MKRVVTFVNCSWAWESNFLSLLIFLNFDTNLTMKVKLKLIHFYFCLQNRFNKHYYACKLFTNISCLSISLLCLLTKVNLFLECFYFYSQKCWWLYTWLHEFSCYCWTKWQCFLGSSNQILQYLSSWCNIFSLWRSNLLHEIWFMDLWWISGNVDQFLSNFIFPYPLIDLNTLFLFY